MSAWVIPMRERRSIAGQWPAVAPMSQPARSWNAGWPRSKVMVRRPIRLRAMSVSATFAALLMGGVAALGLLLLILLIMLVMHSTTSRSGG
jgi:hypothetical protein